MTFHVSLTSIVRVRNAMLFLAASGLCGCAVVGPQAITAGRGVYTEVINQTENEQILDMLVRERYDQTFGMLSVASITANLQFSARADADIGIGESDNYAGNLVPFSAGVGYEENPTISYIPLSGEQFIRRMLTPVAPSDAWLLTQFVQRDSLFYILAARRINGLHNDLLGEEAYSPEFLRFAELFEELRRNRVIDVVQTNEAAKKGEYIWYAHNYQGAYHGSLRELFDLIGIKAKLDGSPIYLPLQMGIGQSDSAIHLQTRSAYGVLRILSRGIEIPPPHLEAGIVEPVVGGLPPQWRMMTVLSSRQRPDNATVRILFRDWWFYIDDTDTQSKRGFRFLRTFIGMRLADPSMVRGTPVITVPVK